MLPELLLHLLAAPLVLAPPDPCTLVTAADITAAVGGKPSAGSKDGPMRDEESHADVSSCSYSIGGLYLVIGVAEFADGAAAAAAVKETERISKDTEGAVSMGPQPGVGEGALWGANEEGAIWVARKGKYMLNVTLAGKIGDGAKYRDPLKRLASAALTKL